MYKDSIAITFVSKINKMQKILSNISIQVNKNIFLKNPESTELGKKILSGSIEMIADIGFEAFTFRKLAKGIGSTEASIYRYFESKHKLLLYLTYWYWAWLEYRIVFSMANIDSPKDRLQRAITLLVEEVKEDNNFTHINEIKLHHVVIADSSKAYLTKSVDEENKVGIFGAYKQLVERVSQVILEINPSYKYPHMLVSTVIEGSHHERYFAEHLPKLTDVVQGEDSITEFYKEIVFKTIL